MDSWYWPGEYSGTKAEPAAGPIMTTAERVLSMYKTAGVLPVTTETTNNVEVQVGTPGEVTTVHEYLKGWDWAEGDENKSISDKVFKGWDEDMAKQPNKVNPATGVSVEAVVKKSGKLVPEMVAFKKQLKTNSRDKNYPADYLNNDIVYFLEHTRDKYFNLGVYRPEHFPGLKDRYCPMRGSWRGLDLKHLLMVKDRVIPSKLAIRSSFMRLLNMSINDVPNTDDACYLKLGNYIWTVSQMYSGQIRALFNKIINSKHPNRIEWAEYFQNKLLSIELRPINKKRNQRGKSLSDYEDDQPAKISFRAPSSLNYSFSMAKSQAQEAVVAAIADQSIPLEPRIQYPIKVRPGDTSGLPLGNYRWVEGYRNHRLEDEDGSIFIRKGDGSWAKRRVLN